MRTVITSSMHQVNYLARFSWWYSRKRTRDRQYAFVESRLNLMMLLTNHLRIFTSCTPSTHDLLVGNTVTYLHHLTTRH